MNLGQVFYNPPKTGNICWFVEFIGKDLCDEILKLGLKKPVVYFDNQETFSESIEDFQTLAEFHRGRILYGKGRYLSGMRTVACSVFQFSDKIYEAEIDFGYEGREIEALRSLDCGPWATQDARRAVLESIGVVVPESAKVEFCGASFKYLL